MGREQGLSPTACRRLAFLLIAGSALLRLCYLAAWCPLDLAPDEAHYWDWSRHLDWSYYSKGPLVAYLIRAGDALFGSLAEAWTGNHMLAVRIPAVLCGALLLSSLYILTLQVYRRERLALVAVALAMTLPIVNVGSTLITIDAPYTCCWGWALVLGYEAVLKQKRWAWPLLGLVIGIGILAKYTMVLFIPSLFLLLLTTPVLRRQLRQRGFWLMTAIAAFCCLPILIWNAQHGWVTFRHVGGQAGVTDHYLSWIGPLEYVAVQFALLLGFWFVAWVRALFANWPTSDRDLGGRYLWWLSVPMFVVFLLFSIKTREEPNWPVTAYLSGLVLLTAWLERELTGSRPIYRRMAWTALLLAVGLGTGLSLLIHDSRPIRPLLAWLVGPATTKQPLPLRRIDPTCRLRGWRALAAAVDKVRSEERTNGEPVLAATSWTIPGELGFYCIDHPQAYSLGLAVGERHSQYELWHPNPLAEPEAFRGHTFIVVGDPGAVPAAAFARLKRTIPVLFTDDGYPLASWTIAVYEDYQGFPTTRPASY